MTLVDWVAVALGSAVGYGLAYFAKKYRRVRRKTYAFAVHPPSWELVAIGSKDAEVPEEPPDDHICLCLGHLEREGAEQLRKRIETDRDVRVKVEVDGGHYWRPATTKDLYALIELAQQEMPFYYGARKRVNFSNLSQYKLSAEEDYSPDIEFKEVGNGDEGDQWVGSHQGLWDLSLNLLASEGLERVRERIANRELDIMVYNGEDEYPGIRIATAEDLDAMIDLAWRKLPQYVWWEICEGTGRKKLGRLVGAGE